MARAVVHGGFTLQKQDVLRTQRRACTLLGVESLYLPPGGLRGGSAMEHLLVHRDISLLGRRSRWASERTLKRYVQERGFHTLQLPASSRS